MCCILKKCPQIALIKKTTTLLYALFMNESNLCSETFLPNSLWILIRDGYCQEICIAIYRDMELYCDTYHYMYHENIESSSVRR